MLAITGTPGVGKHTIGKQIAQEMKLDIIDINEIAISNGLAKRGRVNDIDTDELAVGKNIFRKDQKHPYIDKIELNYQLVAEILQDR